MGPNADTCGASNVRREREREWKRYWWVRACAGRRAWWDYGRLRQGEFLGQIGERLGRLESAKTVPPSLNPNPPPPPLPFSPLSLPCFSSRPGQLGAHKCAEGK